MLEEFMTQLGLTAPEAFTFGIMGGLILVFFTLLILVYVYTSFALMTLAKRLKTENAWLAWIPLANVYLITQIAKKEWWWTLIMIFAGVVPFIGWLFSVGATIYMYYLIAERRKYPGWSAILMIIPFVNLIYLGFLAWGK